MTEARGGNPEAVAKRLEILRDIPELRISEEAKNLAAALLSENAVPQKAGADALHIAIAATHGMDFLLTWNCRHIDNPAMKPLMRVVCSAQGYACPEICTPIELMEVAYDEE